MRRSARLVARQDDAINTTASTTIVRATTTNTTLPPPADTLLALLSPVSPAPSSVLSPAPSEDDRTFTLVPLSLPDDILSYICAALRGMMEDPIEPTAADGIILRTLLDIQVVSKAGWRAATPFIWGTLRFEIDYDYVSFFSPITRLLREARCVTKERTACRVIKMIKDDARRPADVDRFFGYTRWVRTIHIHRAPPLAIQEELSLIGDIAKELVGTSMYLGEDIDLNLSNDICSLLMHDCLAPKATFRFRQLVKGFLPAEITIVSPPEERVWPSDMSWKNFEETGKDWKDVPMFIYNSLPGQLRQWCHRHTTVFVAHPSLLSVTRDYDAAALSDDIGWFIANCNMDDDPDCTATRLEVYAPMEYIGEHSYTWMKRQEADEDEEDDTDEAIALFTNGIIAAASLILEKKGHLGCTKEVHAERIRNAFESGRLVIGTYA